MNDKRPISTRYPDLLSNQDDSALLDLVEDLDTLYTSQTLPARLARPVETSLLTDPEQAPAPLPAQSGTLASFTPKRHTRWPRLSALAAVLFTTLLVGALIGTFALARRNAGTVPQGAASHAVICHIAHASPLPLQDVQMMTATTGWAISWHINGRDSYELVHTVDGGCHWKIVTPANHGSLFASHYYYISGTAAWLELVDSVTQKTYFARTTNSGSTWQFTLSPDDNLSLASPTMGPIVTFLTPDIGWLLASTRSGKASDIITGIALYHTVDGGLTWKELMHSSGANPVTPGGLPTTRMYTGLRFLNQSTGWATGESSSSNGTWLYVTHDGGRSWQKQDLPTSLAASYAQMSGQGLTITYPPQFFSARNGVLTVAFTSPHSPLIYTTHDGGATWQPGRSLPITPGTLNMLAVTPLPSFIGTGFGWFWTGAFYQPSNTLFVTHNAGQNWTQIKTSLPTSISALQTTFVSSNVGWAIVLNTRTAEPAISYLLYQTVDGGKTWTHINYTVA